MRNLVKCSAILLISASLFAQAAGDKPAASPSPQATQEQPAAGGVTTQLAEAYFQRMFGYEPDLSVKVIKIEPSPVAGLTEVTALFSTPEGQQVNRWYVSQDLQHVILGDMLPFGADPFLANRKKLESSVFGPSKGPGDAKMLIVEFADLECPACREAAPIMDNLRKDFPQARFVFQSFPLPQHPWAAKAAAYLDCIARGNSDQAFTFIDSVFAQQKEIEDAVRKTGAEGAPSIDDAALSEQLRKYTTAAGADAAKIEACAATEDTAQRVLRSELLGKAVGVNSTPTLYVNGRRVGNFTAAQYDVLKSLTAYELEQASKGESR